jgi:hypothetical protein
LSTEVGGIMGVNLRPRQEKKEIKTRPGVPQVSGCSAPDLRQVCRRYSSLTLALDFPRQI